MNRQSKGGKKTEVERKAGVQKGRGVEREQGRRGIESKEATSEDAKHPTGVSFI